MDTTFSILNLFTQSDVVIRLLSVILVAGSVASWTIIVEKSLVLKRIKLASAIFERQFWSGGSLDDLFAGVKNKTLDPMAAVFVAAMKEWKKSSGLLRGGKAGGAKSIALSERIDRVMAITSEREMARLEERIDWLSLIGTTSPLLGLFGTVWGIMEAFGAIGRTGNSSIGVLAPGVADALATTALGLIVAIPAVIGYNKIWGELGRYALKLESFTGEFTAIASRQIDETMNA
ncbi:MAG: MotA/TolQ/ExbB proton channel family protein [Rickettsiales bacterium]|jgi:biopolymer transport protein TolQ|nr:MotA/TolQ/ExbB proton channel family protein [Rickettsiales bacterium]